MATTNKDKYIEAVGRRKTAIARVRLFKSTKNEVTINERPLDNYFPTKELRSRANEVMKKFTEQLEKFSISAKIVGGGPSAQAEALKMGIARALIKVNDQLKPQVKKEGLLTRDAREKERRKFGLKKARKAPQWSKR